MNTGKQIIRMDIRINNFKEFITKLNRCVENDDIIIASDGSINDNFKKIIGGK